MDIKNVSSETKSFNNWFGTLINAVPNVDLAAGDTTVVTDEVGLSLLSTNPNDFEKVDASGLPASVEPQTGNGVPQTDVAVTSRFEGDSYVDLDTGLKYTNPNPAGSTTGWELYSTTPVTP